MDNQEMYELIKEIRADVKELNKNFVLFHTDTSDKLSEYNEQLKIHIARSDLLETQCNQRHSSDNSESSWSGKQIAAVVSAVFLGVTGLVVAIIKLFVGA